MRPIKFRGFDQFYNKWRYGSLLQDDDGACSIYYDGDEFTVDLDTLGQFAGKTDKNGKDIYEGDILQYHNVISTVTWDEENLIYIAISNSFRFDLTSWEGCEIIGNIHDNPELLEGK